MQEYLLGRGIRITVEQHKQPGLSEARAIASQIKYCVLLV